MYQLDFQNQKEQTDSIKGDSSKLDPFFETTTNVLVYTFNSLLAVIKICL